MLYELVLAADEAYFQITVVSHGRRPPCCGMWAEPSDIHACAAGTCTLLL